MYPRQHGTAGIGWMQDIGLANVLDSYGKPGLAEDVDKVMNMTLSILGPGVLSIPFAFKVRTS
jgi:hypothetical protein